MKLLARNLSALTFLSASGLGSADVIYSGLQGTAIALTYEGINIDVDFNATWDLNPYLGGVYLANNTAFQPARDGTDGMDTIQRFGSGVIINSGLLYATGMGGSIDHLGSTFTAGEEGYLGFRLNGTDYGWMRVVFTNNTGGALVKDWAHDTGGGAIATGNVLQSGSTFTLNSAMGSFTLGSQIGATNSVVKAGANSATLTGTNGYSGTTNVNDGTLVIDGNISTSSLTTVAVGATLAGTGTVGKTIIDGTLAVGNSPPGTMTFTDTLDLNGITLTEIDGTGHDFVNLTGAEAAGVLTYGGTMTLDIGVIFGAGVYSWNLFDMASETGTFTAITLDNQYSGILLDDDSNGVWDLASGDNTWQFTESTGVLGLTVVPEPRAALLGGLGLLMLLRRRRN